jgi:TldD protein
VTDPTLPDSYGYYLYDDEGVQARRRELIKGGVINEFLHNRETASQLGLASNGSARCNQYNREPIVRMANTYVEAGEWSRAEIIEEPTARRSHQLVYRVNIDGRRYNQRYGSREAYIIEDGDAAPSTQARVCSE